MSTGRGVLPAAGDRVRMIGVMEDPDPLPVGAEGTVRGVSPAPPFAQIDVEWDNGRTLFLLPGDPFVVVRRAAAATTCTFPIFPLGKIEDKRQ